MHAQAYSFVAHAASEHQARGPVYEIGSRNINGTVRGLFRHADVYLGVDVCSGQDVDLVADAVTYEPPFAPASVICCEVLEHTPAAEAIVKRVGAILAPDGLFIATMAGEGREPHSAVDGGPLRAGEFYHNISIAEIITWAEAADLAPVKVTADPVAGDLYFIGRKR